MPGRFPLGWLFIAVVLATTVAAFDGPIELAYVALAIFVPAGLFLLGGSLWILYLLLRGGNPPQEEAPDECWPFPDRASYEEHRDA
ncbi:MAG: hypothetical protein AAF628_34220 [Planctomycetota bacterium]